MPGVPPRMTTTFAWIILIFIAVAMGVVFGMWFERKRFAMTTEAQLRREVQALQEERTKHDRTVQYLKDRVTSLNRDAITDQVFNVLQSHGWRPLTAESQPADNEQILVASIILTPQSRAPNGYHYARFKRVNDKEGRLSFAGSGGQPVPLDGETLWIPQRVLLK